MRPSERAPELDIPPELDALCLTATAHDVAARPLGVRIIADAIERYLEGDRDLAVRRRLAVKHAEAASIAASQALTASPDAIEARARALKEAGRALTLDPENAAGAATLVQLLAQPPSVLPAEVRLEVERAELVAMRLRNRKGIAMLSAFLLIVCAIPIAGLRSWSLWACIVVPLVAALAMTLWVLFSRDLTVPRFERRTDVVVVLGLTAVASCALTMTSSVIVPVLALAFTMGAVGASRPARRPRYLAMGLCAFLVPFVVEWLHLAPDVLPGLQFVPGGAFIPAGATTLPALATRVLLLLATCASILTPMLTVFPVLDAAAELRTQSFLHAWQLRQLAPGEPRSDSAAAVRDPP
jgi:serine/threonine-protein kinase